MPTINQLVRKNRKDKTRKSKSPVLGIGYNSKDKKRTNQNKSLWENNGHLRPILCRYGVSG